MIEVFFEKFSALTKKFSLFLINPESHLDCIQLRDDSFWEDQANVVISSERRVPGWNNNEIIDQNRKHTNIGSFWVRIWKNFWVIKYLKNLHEPLVRFILVYENRASKMNFFFLVSSKMGFKMNLRMITKNHAADPEIGFLTKSISKPNGRATDMPTAWDLRLV